MNTEQAIAYFESMLVHCDNDENRELCNVVLPALRAQVERENPKPLTLDELRQRDGKPVFVVCGYEKDDLNGWFIVSASVHNIETAQGIDTEYSLGLFNTENELYPDQDFYGLTGADSTRADHRLGLHVLGWLAYDHEPKEAR